MNAHAPSVRRPRFSDPRHYQIAVLSSLVTFGVVGLDFGIHASHVVVTVAVALAMQYAGTHIYNLPRFDPLSALITSLSLTLLLRTDHIELAALAALLAIGSKFLLRMNGKHIFNPANFAIVVLIVTSDDAWISSGQWGSAAIGALALACLGFIVLTHAKRSETTFAFLTGFAALTVGRAIWLGDPLSIPLHQLSSGALLIFAFFMISDPKTTPDSRAGRIIYGLLVATVAYVIRFVFFEPGAPLLALIVCAPLVPVIDALCGGDRYRWSRPAGARKPERPPTDQLPKGVLQ